MERTAQAGNENHAQATLMPNSQSDSRVISISALPQNSTSTAPLSIDASPTSAGNKVTGAGPGMTSIATQTSPEMVYFVGLKTIEWYQLAEGIE